MRLRVDFSYLGKGYCGYQKQVGKKTVQGELESVLSDFFGEKITFTASGRTDAGVSALRQVGHFDLTSNQAITLVGKEHKSWQSLAIRINYILPEDIRILEIKPVSDDFHSRFTAKRKTYCYNFYCSKVDVPYLSQFCLWLKEKELDFGKMKSALKNIEGKHDFTAFCASNTEVEDKVREIYSADIVYNELGYYTISICGNGFLYNMVRIIVGTILDVGRGKIQVGDVKKIIDSKDRTSAGKTVSAVGLVLKDVVI